MKLTLNMQNVGNRFEAVPDDLYRVQITSLEEKEGDKGAYLFVHMEIVEGPFAGERELSANWFFGNGLWKTKPALEAFTGSKWDQDNMDFDSDEFVGLEAMVSTSQEAYPKNDGTTGVKSNITDYFPVPENATSGSL